VTTDLHFDYFNLSQAPKSAQLSGDILVHARRMATANPDRREKVITVLHFDDLRPYK
jgi:hypothetical protein